MIEMFPLRVYPLTIKCMFQQLLNVSVEDANAKRYFYAVQGSRRQKGELFGVKNMFQLNTGSSCKTVDILKVSAEFPLNYVLSKWQRLKSVRCDQKMDFSC